MIEPVLRKCPWCKSDVDWANLSPRILPEYPFDCPHCGKRIVFVGRLGLGNVLKIVGVACE